MGVSEGCVTNGATSLSREEREGLARQFDEMGRREIGARAFERFSAMAEELEMRFAEGYGSES